MHPDLPSHSRIQFNKVEAAVKPLLLVGSVHSAEAAAGPTRAAARAARVRLRSLRLRFTLRNVVVAGGRAEYLGRSL